MSVYREEINSTRPGTRAMGCQAKHLAGLLADERKVIEFSTIYIKLNPILLPSPLILHYYYIIMRNISYNNVYDFEVVCPGGFGIDPILLIQRKNVCCNRAEFLTPFNIWITSTPPLLISIRNHLMKTVWYAITGLLSPAQSSLEVPARALARPAAHIGTSNNEVIEKFILYLSYH